MKKLTALFLALGMIFVLCACGSQPTGTTSDKTAEEKVLVVATNVAFPPYEYYESEKAVGIDVDILQAIATKLGMTLKVDDMEFGSIITAVSSGKADIGFGAITVTEDRAKSIDFTTSYATGIQSVIVTKDSTKITKVEDLKALLDAGTAFKIGVQQDTTGDIYATEDFGEEHISRYNKGADAVQALLTGKVDCVIIDNEPAKSFLSANDGLKMLDSAYTEEAYAFEIAKGNDALYKQVNGALEELIADGTVQSIIDKYIKAD